MADDLARGILAASRVAEQNRQYLVAQVRCYRDVPSSPLNDVQHAIVCYIKDGEDILGSSIIPEMIGVTDNWCQVPLQTLLNDGWRIERAYDLRPEGGRRDISTLLSVLLLTPSMFLCEMPPPRAY